MDAGAEFAQRLRYLRKAAGRTQKDLADCMTAAGLTFHQTTVAKIEAGERAASVGEAVQLAAILGAPLADLIASPPARDPLLVARAQLRAAESEVERAEEELEARRATLATARRRLRRCAEEPGRRAGA